MPILLKIINVVDVITISFFTLEYFIRLACAPRKLKFMRGPMNMIDLFAIIPFFLSLLLEGLEDFEIIGKTGKMIRLVRVMRILRIFKLVRHFAGLQSLFYTLQQAYQELGLLLVIIAVAILTYSSLVYFAEKEVPDGVNCSDWSGSGHHWELEINHPCYVWTFVESFWWCLMTITTVGYELSPKSFLGKTPS